MFSRLLLVPAVLVLSLSMRVNAEENTQTRLSRFGQELADAWAKYPTERDSIVRKQLLADLSNSISTDLNKLESPANITVQKAVDNLLSNVQKSRSLFKQDRMNNERQIYVASCTVAFRRDLNFATDLTADRTASKCFDIMVDWVTNSRTALQSVSPELHSGYYSGLVEAFTRMVKVAQKDADTPSAVYEKQLTFIKRKFPTVGDFQKTNGPIASALEQAAKAVNTRNKVP